MTRPMLTQNGHSEYHHPSDRLERLMDEAEELFRQEGFLHLSTDDLAQLLHCSKRTLYAIAPGRERFFEAVIARRISRQERELIAQVEQAPDVQAAITACIETMVRNLENMSPVYLRDYMRFPPSARAVKRFQKQITDAMVRAIERGERENIFRKIEARVAAEALFAAVMRMIETDFLAASPVTAAEAVRQVSQIFWRGLRLNQEPDPAMERLPHTRMRIRDLITAEKD